MEINASHFSSFFKKFAPAGNLTENQKQKLTSHLKVVSVREKTHLFKPDMTCKEIHFIVEGLFMSYELVKGEEYPISFFQANEFMTDLHSMSTPSAARSGLVCLKNAVLISIPIYTWKQLCDEDRHFDELAKALKNKQFSKLYRRITRLIKGNTEDRLQQLNTIFPGILNVISQHLLANYFGVTDQAISKATSRLK